MPAHTTIKGADYYIASYPTGPDGLRSYRVESGRSDYDVAEHPDGRVSCTCNDYRYRHADLPGFSLCKHGQALADLGLVRVPVAIA